MNQSIGGAATNFYLARVVPEYAGQILELEFFDVADGSNGTLTVTPPGDMTGQRGHRVHLHPGRRAPDGHDVGDVYEPDADIGQLQRPGRHRADPPAGRLQL